MKVLSLIKPCATLIKEVEKMKLFSKEAKDMNELIEVLKNYI